VILSAQDIEELKAEIALHKSTLEQYKSMIKQWAEIPQPENSTTTAEQHDDDVKME
jgi:hypothetical protein